MSTFAELGLKPQLLKAIESQGYTTPTQIQSEVRNAASTGTNIVGQSQTGTGKTTAFLLPLLQAIDNRVRHPQVLIVAPTRELVMQIREDIMKLTEFLPMRSLCLIGGRKLSYQKEDLRYGPQFLVATPGRLIECIQERLIDCSKISHFVLDEVDRMLDMGFIEDVDRIWSQLDNLKQTMTFSATINDEIKTVINNHCKEFIHIRVGEKLTVDKIDHTYIDVTHEHKFSTLMNIIKQHKDQKTIIFAQTKRNTEVITRALNDNKCRAEYLNGDLDMRQRTRALRGFKEGTCKILVTTDVAARGLNMDNVELVVNFEVPREPESYIHRIGRTGRAGATGKAIMFVDHDEKHLTMEIEKTQKLKLKKSEHYTMTPDENEDYIDVNLDRPIPPSEKKRRMVARSLARDSGGYRSSGGYDRGGRSGGGSGRGGYGNRSYGERSSYNDRPRYGNDRGHTGSRDSDRPRSYDRTGGTNYGTRERPTRDESRSDTRPQRSADRGFSERPSRGSYDARPTRSDTGRFSRDGGRTDTRGSSRSFGTGSRSGERGGQGSRGRGDFDTPRRPRGGGNSIGGYDVPAGGIPDTRRAPRKKRTPQDNIII